MTFYCVNLQVHVYCDLDWGCCPLTRRSLMGYLVTLGGCPVSWKTKKQPMVSRSSAEAEYLSMATMTGELAWVKSLSGLLGVFPNIPMRLYYDSQAALHITKKPVFHECTKYIEIDCHFVHKRL